MGNQLTIDVAANSSPEEPWQAKTLTKTILSFGVGDNPTVDFTDVRNSVPGKIGQAGAVIPSVSPLGTVDGVRD